jgi:hypothetical protein
MLPTPQEFQLKFAGLLKGISDKISFRNHSTIVFPQYLSCLVKKMQNLCKFAENKEEKVGTVKVIGELQ